MSFIQWIKIKTVFTILLLTVSIFNEIHAVPQINSSSKMPTQAQLLNIPLSFEKNEGQIDKRAKYLVRGRGFTMFFTPQEMMIALSNETNPSSFVLKMQFIGANSNPQIEGLEKQTHKSNYIIGNESQNWRSNISNYSKICYREIYQGIDVVFYGNGRQLEYDIYVAPGSNPKQARFQIEGAEKLQVDEEGCLHITIADQKELQMKKPFIYQINEGKQTTINGSFELLADNEIGFKLGNYDPSQALIIDPILGFSTYLGTTNDDFGTAIAVDSVGNVYVTGNTTSASFPTTPGAFQTTFGGGSADAVVTKLDPTLSTLIYSTFLGGNASDFGNAITVDSEGNAFITGGTNSNNFPTTPGAFQTTNISAPNAFITKLDPLGQSLVYSTYLRGATNTGSGRSINVDSAGNAYITGITTSNTFPTTLGAAQTIYGGVQDAFVTKINPTGTALIYSTFLGGSLTETATGIVIDSMDNAYVTGFTNSLNFPTTPGAYQTSLMGIENNYITKLNSTGTSFIYSTYIGGNGSDTVRGIAIDSTGHAYIAGRTTSANYPITPMAFQTSLSGPSDIFITKMDPLGQNLVYSTYLGGTGNEQAYGIALDSSNNAYITGQTTSNDFPITSDAFQSLYGGGSTDAFFTQMDSTGTVLIYSTYLGGNGGDGSRGIALDNNQNIYLIGFTSSPNFPTTVDAYQTSFGGIQDIFITRFLTTTTTMLGVFPNPAIFGQTVTLTATLSPSIASGTVSFYNGMTLLGSSPVVGGVAVFSTDTFSVGVHTLTADYSGNANFIGSVSEPVNLVVNPIIIIPTSTTLIASPNPVISGEPITFTATVFPPTATGTVNLFSGDNLLGTAILVNGTATFVITAPDISGTIPIIAVYGGDDNFSGSTSARVFLIINPSAFVLPPRNIKIIQIENRFATQADVMNILKWKSPLLGNTPLAYRIYRDSPDNLIAVVDANKPLIYKDHNRKKGKKYRYYLISEDRFGNLSESEIITIR